MESSVLMRFRNLYSVNANDCLLFNTEKYDKHDMTDIGKEKMYWKR